MATFLVLLHRCGAAWVPSLPMEEQSEWLAHASFMDELVSDGFVVLAGPLADDFRVVEVVEADSEETVRARLALDPWSHTHLQIQSVERWSIRLDRRRPQHKGPAGQS